MTEKPQAPKRRVLLYLPWKIDMLGGVDVVVVRLWGDLERRFPGIGTIGIQDWEFRGCQMDDQGRRCLHLNLPEPPSAEAKLPLRYLLTLARRLPSLLRDLRKHEIATVNMHFPRSNAYPLALLKRLGLWQGRIVLSFHGSDVGEILPNSTCWQAIAEQTDAITACSADLARRIEELKLFRQPVQVIHNGIDCERFVSTIDPCPFPFDSPYILNVGNYIPRKAQDVLLNAFAQVVPDFPNLKVVFAGGTANNGTWLQHLKELADRLNLGTKVVFLENQSQIRVASLMRSATCLAHTAHNEPFGLVLIEAGACGTPVIATRVGGIPEIIPSSTFGLLCEDGDVRGFANAMISVMQFPKESRNRADSLKNRVLKHFSTDVMLNGYLSVIYHNGA